MTYTQTSNPSRRGSSRMLLWLAFIAGVLAIGFVLYPQLSDAQYYTGSGGTITVGIYDDYYSPASVSVTPGTTVIFRNYGARPHTVSSSSGIESGTIAPGGSFSYTFWNTGTISYYCRLHPQMMGSVTVTGSSYTNPGYTYYNNYGNYNYSGSYGSTYYSSYPYNYSYSYPYSSSYGYGGSGTTATCTWSGGMYSCSYAPAGSSYSYPYGSSGYGYGSYYYPSGNYYYSNSYPYSSSWYSGSNMYPYMTGSGFYGY